MSTTTAIAALAAHLSAIGRMPGQLGQFALPEGVDDTAELLPLRPGAVHAHLRRPSGGASRGWLVPSNTDEGCVAAGPASPRATIQTFAASCSWLELAARPTFAGALQFELGPLYSQAGLPYKFLVLGSRLAPQPLPTPLPCLLMPAVDAVGMLSSIGQLDLPMANLRPLQFYAQAVAFDSVELHGSGTLAIRYP